MSVATASNGSRIATYEDFVKVHGLLLAASGLPRSLHFKLFQKLTSETFDGGAHFEIEPCEDGRQRRLLLTSETMAKDSNVFLIDHAWTFRASDAYKQLQEVPGLAQRMAALMCVEGDDDDGGLEQAVECGGKMTVEEALESEIRNAKESGDGFVRWLELEELGLDDTTLLSLDLSTKFPDLLALSLCGNKLDNREKIVEEVTKFKNLKGLWLNNNPVIAKSDCGMEDAILRGCLKLEIYNSRFTRNFGVWALGFCADVYGKDNPGSGHLGDLPLQSVTSLDLSNRGIHSLINKAFSPFEMPNLSYLNIRGNPIEENSVSDLFGLLKAFYCLQSLEPRLPEWTAGEPLVDRVLNAMWLYLMTYRLADEEKLDETPVWYVMDELGSALRHSDEPNFRVAPFLFMPEGNLASAVSFSILWPFQNVKKGDECTRDYLFGIGEDKQRSARLTAWFHTPQLYFIQEYEKHFNNLQSKSLPSLPVNSSAPSVVRRIDGSALRVYTDIPQVEEFLTRPEFVITNEPKDADIIWTSMQIDEEMKKAVGITDQQYRDGRNNLWILKPWNMARTIDTTVTDNLSAIIRLMETGPKICQKYIEHPALFLGKKFDLRYIVLVRSINPLEIFLSDIFWVRLANNLYTLEKHSLFEYETHFTVMNYGRRLNHMNTPEFVMEFEKEHRVKWLDIHQRVKSMIRSVFESAASVHPEMHDPKSRAMYGVDVMLDASFQPKLLEVTYCPDCGRACKYDTEAIIGGGETVRGRDFFNLVFGCLFLNETVHVSQL
ncbi:hypothetical protein F3Y22_tig00111234pilonHSYRG00209 [Hibiscus syriacus]|uniref:Tubulin--tyrosine ligase-like protein 12 SET-like domain-containing protein n=1 Tax=Hibiscus syriacus TaxID=106335 RepID=A0A6A2YUF0_HIBSY|nr:hypothetical protein F3Y22_tig00111234pilonHSYRG00209 [Hibiscus syriacus]